MLNKISATAFHVAAASGMEFLPLATPRFTPYDSHSSLQPYSTAPLR